ncbi:MAG TPA: T9SS type A sorting domain-containing protein [Chitinophagales bacterium]|nr:T9SS type A sorting domain-containing protein [Chitinophagales bacterium]
MKKVLLFIFTAFTIGANAQITCTPNNNNTTVGSTPRADSIPCIERGVYYEQVVNVLLPTQYTVQGINATIDSFKMETVSNLPSGINYVCYNATCTFIGGKNGCFVVYGTTTDTAKRYDIAFTGTAYVKAMGFPTTYPIDESMAQQAGFSLYLKVIEKDSACQLGTPTSIKNIAENTQKINARFDIEKQQIIVELATLNSQAETIELFDLAGKKIYAQTINNTSGVYTLEYSNLRKGLYFVRANNTATKVLVY